MAPSSLARLSAVAPSLLPTCAARVRCHTPSRLAPGDRRRGTRMYTHPQHRLPRLRPSCQRAKPWHRHTQASASLMIVFQDVMRCRSDVRTVRVERRVANAWTYIRTQGALRVNIFQKTFNTYARLDTAHHKHTPSLNRHQSFSGQSQHAQYHYDLPSIPLKPERKYKVAVQPLRRRRRSDQRYLCHPNLHQSSFFGFIPVR